MHHAAQIFANDVELEVYNATNGEVVEVGMLESIWNDAYLESVVCGTAYGEGNAVDGDAALVHTEVATANHILVALVLEGKLV